MFYSTGACPLGWTHHLSSCFFYNVGASTYRQAAAFCLTGKAGVLSVLMPTELQPMVDSFITYEDLDGTEKRSVIWLSNGLDNARVCPVYPGVETDGSGGVVGESNCDELHPFICRRASVVRCKNSCFNRGSCVGLTCVCFRLVTVFPRICVCMNYEVDNIVLLDCLSQ